MKTDEHANMARHTLCVFFLGLIVISLQLSFLGGYISTPDSVRYLEIAFQLHETGIFKDNTHSLAGAPPGIKGEGMFFAPLYPVFISAHMHISESLVEYARCSVEHRDFNIINQVCNLGFGVFWITQAILGAIACVFVWLSCQVLFNKISMSWICFFLIVTLGTFADYAHTILTEPLVMTLFYATTYYLICTIKKSNWQHAIFFGISCGLLILTRSAFLYMFYFFLALGICLAIYQLKNKLFNKSCQLLFLFGLSTSIIFTPWVYRNYEKIGIPAVTHGYGAAALAQRVAYNDMTAKEWWIGWIYGIPSEGDAISELLFDKEDYERWEYYNPKGFYHIGNYELYDETLVLSGGHEEHLGYLIKNHVLTNLTKHIVVTLPIVFRGMWVFEAWYFIPYLALIYILYICIRQKNYLYVFYTLPSWFMLGLHGFVSVNVDRYNIIMQGCLAVALAYCLYMIVAKSKYLRRR